MTPEQAERMASTMNNSRELRTLKALEGIAGQLGLITQYLAMFYTQMYPPEEEKDASS